MPIQRKGKSNFSEWADAKMQANRMALKTILINAGNNAIRVMRSPERTRYTDRTNNLRSSTGFVVTEGSNIVVSSGFKPEGTGKEGDGKLGSQEGEHYADELKQIINKGKFSLILVAGMNYAEYVEDMGLDVLGSATMSASKEVNRRISTIFGKK